MLDELCCFGNRNRLPSSDLVQVVEESGGRIAGIQYLRPGAPPLRRSLLEESDRIQVAIVKIPKLRLLERSRQGHRHRMVRQSLPQRHCCDDAGILRLLWGDLVSTRARDRGEGTRRWRDRAGGSPS